MEDQKAQKTITRRHEGSWNTCRQGEDFHVLPKQEDVERSITVCKRSVENFESALSLLQQHPEYNHFLEDKGEGNPPLTYLWAIEVGFRNYSSDIYCMGTFPLRSPEYWGKVDKWRKREAYISLVR